jgi:hypothetical protein
MKSEYHPCPLDFHFKQICAEMVCACVKVTISHTKTKEIKLSTFCFIALVHTDVCHIV